MSSQNASEITVRRATQDDVAVCGQICYAAFKTINEKHGFPCDFPDATRPTGELSMMFSNPQFYCVVAEVAGRIAGSNCLDERSIITGIGPITIDPGIQNRGIELSHAINDCTAKVVEREGRITGYASNLAFSGYATAESNIDLQALIASAESFAGPGILIPTRNSALFRWCLANGLQVVQPMTLMTMGLYNEPAGTWLPSILF